MSRLPFVEKCPENVFGPFRFGSRAQKHFLEHSMKIPLGSLFIALMSPSLALFSGCSTCSTHIFPGEAGGHVVFSSAKTEQRALMEALIASQLYCKKSGETSILMSQTLSSDSLEQVARAPFEGVTHLFGKPEENSSHPQSKTAILTFHCR